MARESEFQRKLIEELELRFPGCCILKNDSQYIQGFPDLTMLYGKHWAVLETKRQPKSSKRPNQEHYVEKLNDMSYSSFVNPKNKELVLCELEQLFGS